MKEELLRKVKTREAGIGIIGLGYVGLPLAREFLQKDFSVLGFDVDSSKIEKINQGRSYIEHLDKTFLHKYVIEKKKFAATGDFTRLKEVDYIMICVPTPLDDHFNPDLSYVIDSINIIEENLQKGQVIILESTTYPGTTDEVILPILQKSGMQAGKDFYLGYSPEREDPGNKVYKTGNIPKVCGAISPDGKEIIKALYSQIVEVVEVSSPRIAEASKILENTYRAVNIALVNELKVVFERMGIDIWEVIEAAGTKPFGFESFHPGPGLGGHCIPIDPFYLTWKAKEYDIHTRFIELAGEINANMPYYVIERTIKALNREGLSVFGAKILIVGVAYKKDIDDMRESPALKIMQLLEKDDCRVDYYDPYIPRLPRTRKYNFSKKSVELSKLEKNQYDAAIILTDHTNIDYNKIKDKALVIIDTRNALKQKGLQKGKVFKA